MEKYYTLNELAIITGLTTRTLRSYLKMNILSGEKINGIWMFTEEELNQFLSHPTVKPSLQAKKNALVYDFMLDDKKKVNEICSILDFYVNDEEANEISDFFCNEMNNFQDGNNLRFTFSKTENNVRIILKGNEEQVMRILNHYYHKKTK